MIVGDSIPLLLIFLLLIELGLVIGMTVFWVRSMFLTMQACHQVSRSAEPETVWLIFIPVFGFVWQFICVKRISDSLAREYHRRGWHSDENHPALESGILASVVICIVFLLHAFVPMHPGLGFILTLALVLVMFLHANRLNSFRERLEKEYDPTAAFVQIPIMQQQVAPAYYSQQTQTVRQQLLAEQMTSAYAHIPFVPQMPFVPETDKDTAMKNKAQEELEKFMPPDAKTDLNNEETSAPDKTKPEDEDRINRWSPKP
jgi:hypothetical protein